eukprot:TRINITY_DN1325_c0_g2_i1.p1 TRINITY_DN1325_c0_g2~~TRINITY_DN1325_c0_g2_i1.p1  ORF type:complete len:269 (+),score=33.56 TRINITY_DN1325_c0_g2_i1:116-922(+)
MEKLVGEQFVISDGTMVHISEVKKAKIVLLHFAAAWCPPCEGYKPIINKFYADANKGSVGTKTVEIIMVPCEDEEEAFQEHLKEVLWPTIPFGDPRILELQEKFEVDSIPVVMLIRKDGTVGCESVKKMIQTKGAKCVPELLKLMEECTSTNYNSNSSNKTEECPGMKEVSSIAKPEIKIEKKMKSETPVKSAEFIERTHNEDQKKFENFIANKYDKGKEPAVLKEKTNSSRSEITQPLIGVKEKDEVKMQIEDGKPNGTCCIICVIQ